MSLRVHARRIGPGLALCLVVTAAAFLVQAAELHLFGRAWLEALVLAILLGAAVRTAWHPDASYSPGIDVSAKLLLEIAVVLLGLSVSTAAFVAVGAPLILGIAGLVATAILLSYAIGRGLGLSHQLALLIACGNSICGNSAIAATAAVIRAKGDDVAASIAFTAVLGVAVVLAMPLLAKLIGLDKLQAGIFAGLTVYAVPQVIAATAPISAISVQIGTLVKLVRVLMLGPVVLILSVASRGSGRDATRFSMTRAVPWFILGFLGMMGLRSTGIVPDAVLATASAVANLLTVVAMAALGLSVDVRTVAKAGARVTGAVILSLLALGATSLGLIFLVGAP